MRRQLRHASIFSGIGGFDLAAQILGWTNVFYCEVDPFCQKILRHHFPDAISYGNIKTSDFTRHKGQIDILTGGFPCQPFSISGKRRGAEDDRYLWPAMLRAIEEIRPAWVIAENVAGLRGMVFPSQVTQVEHKATTEGKAIHRTLEAETVIHRICEDLEAKGYEVQPLIIPACAVAAPHHRDRIWFIATTTTPTHSTGQRRKRCHSYQQKRPIQNHGQWYDSQDQQAGQRGKHRTRSNGSDGHATHSNGPRLERDAWQRVQTIQGGTAQSKSSFSVAAWIRAKIQAGSFFAPGWQTQSPLCRPDDGLSSQLAGITLPKLRKESLKGYGNAIVVPLVVEIFKAIEAVVMEQSERL